MPSPQETNQATVADEADIEEGREVYQPNGFHPVYIGDVFNSQYKVLNKIGYGVYSTVWLVENLKETEDEEKRFLALKILSADSYSDDKPIWEREILRHLRDGDQSQLGYAYVCHLVDDFEHTGPNGTHVCLVFELMGETLRSFGAWFRDSMLPNPVMRRFTIQLVLALDFAHEHNVIHTDIKPDNIFVKFRDYSLITSGYLADIPIPQQNRNEKQYTVIPSCSLRDYYFNDEDSSRVAEFDITLGDWGVSSWADKHLSEKIQPVALRAPEVLIEAPWDATADWWNLGAVVLEVFQAVRMFTGGVPPDGHYEVKEHLAEMVSLFGPFPRELLEKGNKQIVESYFEPTGEIKDPLALTRTTLESEGLTPGLDPERRELFLSFLATLMKINPADRPSAEDLLRHPWLGAIQ